ncbi:hypothetical protein NUW54_g5235 [Trametes sanguinea]|uniref:Uncharacterized protein n=1 Tax=Trametes sanguinea TaxID=158606 RepID=A0ACC1PZ45_9APHY|nr:hypothetical protein NUW54_g5235 [Trametes sanguinea]
MTIRIQSARRWKSSWDATLQRGIVPYCTPTAGSQRDGVYIPRAHHRAHVPSAHALIVYSPAEHALEISPSMLFDLFPSTRGRYRVAGTLQGHTKSVFSLDFSPDGKLLASGGGGDGVMVWDLRTYVRVRTPEYRNTFGPVSQVMWIPSRSGTPTLCSGTGLGYLCIWVQSTDKGAFADMITKRLGGGSEILGLACDTLTQSDTRIAVSDRSGFVGVFSYEGRAELLPVFTVRINHAIPISLSFAGTRGRELYVFGLHDGTMYKLSGTDGKILKSKSLSDKIGHAAIQVKQQLLVVDNVSSGFDVWSLSGETHQRTFPTGKPTRFVPRQVSFVDDASTIVGGSDHGAVYVFDRKTGAPLDVLQHAQQGLVQTIATTKSGSISMIASATSCGSGSILVWQAKNRTVSSPSRRAIPTLGAVLRILAHVLMMAAAVAFCLQNFKDGIDLTRWTQSVSTLRYPQTPPAKVAEVVRNHAVRQKPVISRRNEAQPNVGNSHAAMLWKAWRTHVYHREAEDARRASGGEEWEREGTEGAPGDGENTAVKVILL